MHSFFFFNILFHCGFLQDIEYNSLSCTLRPCSSWIVFLFWKLWESSLFLAFWKFTMMQPQDVYHPLCWVLYKLSQSATCVLQLWKFSCTFSDHSLSLLSVFLLFGISVNCLVEFLEWFSNFLFFPVVRLFVSGFSFLFNTASVLFFFSSIIYLISSHYSYLPVFLFSSFPCFLSSLFKTSYSFFFFIYFY